MQFKKLHIKKRVVYKYKTPAFSDSKNKHDGIVNDTTLPTITSTTIIIQ